MPRAGMDIPARVEKGKDLVPSLAAMRVSGTDALRLMSTV